MGDENPGGKLQQIRQGNSWGALLPLEIVPQFSASNELSWHLTEHLYKQRSVNNIDINRFHKSVIVSPMTRFRPFWSSAPRELITV